MRIINIILNLMDITMKIVLLPVFTALMGLMGVGFGLYYGVKDICHWKTNEEFMEKYK